MIVFAHGLEGSPHGTKVRALREAGFEVVAPDGRGRDLAARVAGLQEATARGGVVLAGSSYGGLAAAFLAQRFPERFTGLLLCAPAFNLAEAPADRPETIVAPAGLETIVIHGRADDIVPVEVSRAYRDRSGPHVTLREVDDGHRLASSLDAILKAARTLEG